jgi:DNA-binding LytR/AlgR family response regulator
LINVRLIEQVSPDVDDTYTVRLRGGIEASISRRNSRRFREQMGL